MQRQQTGRPVAGGAGAPDEAEGARANYQQVDRVTTDLFGRAGDDPIEMVVNLMSWERIRYVLVEDKDHHLLGLVTYRAVLRFLANGGSMKDTPVSAIMKDVVTTVSVETPTVDAIRLMRRFRFAVW